nr:hypothetical protein [Tanacetum cinerariifolium]
MLEENDYESWNIRMKRPKRDKEFTVEENTRDLVDIQVASILSQGTSNHASMLEENDYESWNIRMKRYNRSKPQEKAIWKSIVEGPAPYPMTLLSLQELFDEYEHFRAIEKESIHEYFICFYKLASDLKITKIKIPAHQQNTKFLNNLPSYWAKECKEPKRAKDSQYYKDKMMLSDAKDRGVILDAKAEAFLADVECTEPYNESLVLTTTTTFQVSHEDAYDSDIDDGPHATAAFMGNLSSTKEANDTCSSKINEVHSNASDSYNSDTNDNTMMYQQYLLLTEVVAPLIEKP